MRSKFIYSHFEYKEAPAKKIKKPPPFFRYVYTFLDRSKRKYIVHIEQFEYNTYAIKFHPADLKNDPKKYNKLTGRGDARIIIYTCIAIMLEVLEKDPIASFGFIGTHITEHTNKKKIEPTLELTKRFRVYRGIMSYFFTDEHFQHEEDEKHSVYIMINYANPELFLKDKLDALVSMRYFQSFYQD